MKTRVLAKKVRMAVAERRWMHLAIRITKKSEEANSDLKFL